MRRLALASLVALPLAAGACANNTTSPTAPTTPTTTDTFTGTVAVGGSDMHNFTVNAEGEVDVTLTAAGPPSTIVEGVGIGTPTSGSTCALLTGGSIQTAAGPSQQESGILTAGTLCVEVFDVGNQTAPITYTVSVKHP